MDEFSVPTVRVVAPISEDNPTGYIVINEADLTDDHELHGDAPPRNKGARPRKVQP